MNKFLVKKILIVEDSEFDRQRIIRALEEDSGNSYEFYQLDQGDDLERTASEWRPDLVILDYSLPVMNGLDRLKQILQNNSKIPFPFVMSTGTGNEEIAVEAMKLGALDYVTKERISSNIIRQVIHRALEKSELQKKLVYQQELIEQNERRLSDYVDELKSEREHRESFVNTLTHDLRNPLAVAMMITHHLRRNLADNEKSLQYIEKIEVTLNRANRMISNLLDANFIKAGEQLPLNIDAHQMNKIVMIALSEMKLVHGDRFIFIATDKIEGYWCKNGVRRILENLCNNAVKYGAANQPITISLVKKDEDVLIEVHNKGLPISPEDQAIIFQALTRTDGAKTGKQKGWGLGLALVKGLAEAHGGSVDVKSTQENGTTFRVLLPINCRKMTPDAQPA